MKKLIYYAGMMLVTVIILPLLIVRGCSPASEQTPPGRQAEEDVRIRVFMASEGKVVWMNLEDYVAEVVAAEMPAEFEPEALKAQAVAARTFAYGRMTGTYTASAGVHDGIHICTDSKHCQAWISKDKALKKWGIFFGGRNWRRIAKAVSETRGLVLTYNQRVANALFHSNSGGKTENCEEVWEGRSEPYLRSVTSMGEDACKDYKVTVSLPLAASLEKIREKYPDLNLKADRMVRSIRILDHTTGGRVNTLKIGNITMKGTDFRSILGLRSANFTIEEGEQGELRITTLGYGHGVGMSQWGANYLAKRGGTFEEILRYYYTGIGITSIKDFKQAALTQ